mmetsp:Transcript_8030/g.17936  ORF Transcript_8030/g.17936 Transcript_8030/m.17936 type:complete len:1503 (+) Transcript_8030:131-4639(+)
MVNNVDSKDFDLAVRVCDRIKLGQFTVPEGLTHLRTSKLTKVVVQKTDTGIFKDAPTPNEVLLDRAIVALCEAYRRVTRPDRIGQQWGQDRWLLMGQVLAKLRGLAVAALWSLPEPSVNPSEDPKVLQSTGLDDPIAAAIAVDNSEGLVDARIVRVAVSLMLGRLPSPFQVIAKETSTICRIVLSHMRSVGVAIERLSGEGEPRHISLTAVKESYSPLAAALTCLRTRIATETGAFMHRLQDTIHVPAQSAHELEGGSPTRQLRQERLPLALVPVRTKSGKLTDEQSLPPVTPVGNHFSYLQESTLLAGIASLAEFVGQPHASSADSPLGDGNEADVAQPATAGLEHTVWNVAFTISQLRSMQKAVNDMVPAVEGAQAVFKKCLETYESCSNAMQRAYGDLRAVRATPVVLAGHEALLELVQSLQGMWGDAGAILAPLRQQDLLAVERVRTRHQKIVMQALNTGGQAAAAVVLAKLLLLEELTLPPSQRQLTEEVPWDLVKPYEMLREVVVHITTRHRHSSKKSTDEREPKPDLLNISRARIMQWLRCPHIGSNTVLAGEVQSQLLERFQTVDAAFEPLLGVCGKARLTLREFRMALCFLELSFNERIVAMLYDTVSEAAGGEATLDAMFELVTRNAGGGGGASHGPAAASSSAGFRGFQPHHKAAGAQVQGGSFMGSSFEDSHSDWDQPRPRRTRGGGGDLDSSLSNSQQHFHAPKVQPMAGMACPRCLRGSVPVVPHVSIQDLHRQISAGSSQSSAASTPKYQPTEVLHSGHTFADILQMQATERAHREYGEDIVISWATAVLTQVTLLRDNTRGKYFRWLAHIALYAVREAASSGHEPEGSMSDSRQGFDWLGRGRGDVLEAGRRSILSNSSDVAAAAARRYTAAAAPAPALSKARHTMLPNLKAPGQQQVQAAAARGTVITAAIPVVVTKPTQKPSRFTAPVPAEDSDPEPDILEASEQSLVLPDNASNALRVDLGLPSKNERASSRSAQQSKESTGEAGQKQQNNLSSLRARRRGRELRLLAALRNLNVPEADLWQLQKELTQVAEVAGPSPSGVILVGGAARVAQTILMKGISLRQPTTFSAPQPVVRRPITTSDGSDRVTERLLPSRQTAMTMSGSSFYPRSDGRSHLAKLADEGGNDQADRIIKSSLTHQHFCYKGCGYQQQSAEVASALRYLEARLTGTQALASHTPAAERPETLQEVLPLLLPKSTAKRLLAQAHREKVDAEEAELALASAEASTRKSLPAVRVRSPRGGRRRSKSLGAESVSASSSSSSDESVSALLQQRRGPRRSKSSPALVMSAPVRTSAAMPVAAAASQSELHGQRSLLEQLSTSLTDSIPGESGSLHLLEDSVEPSVAEEVNTALPLQTTATMWPTSVRQLFTSVDQRGFKLRKTAGTRKFRETCCPPRKAALWTCGKRLPAAARGECTEQDERQVLASMPGPDEISWRSVLESTLSAPSTMYSPSASSMSHSTSKWMSKSTGSLTSTTVSSRRTRH